MADNAQSAGGGRNGTRRRGGRPLGSGDPTKPILIGFDYDFVCGPAGRLARFHRVPVRELIQRRAVQVIERELEQLKPSLDEYELLKLALHLKTLSAARREGARANCIEASEDKAATEAQFDAAWKMAEGMCLDEIEEALGEACSSSNQLRALAATDPHRGLTPEEEEAEAAEFRARLAAIRADKGEDVEG